MGNAVLHLSSALIALSSYGLILLFLFFYSGIYEKNVARYSTPQQTVFEISLLEIASQNVQHTPQKASDKIPVGEQNASSTPNEGLGVHQLFAQLQTSAPVQKTPLMDSSNSIARKKKASQATHKKEVQEDYVKERVQQILTKANLKKSFAFAVPLGQYDEFYAKISEILYLRWNPAKFAYQEESKVIVTITSKGAYSFKVIKKSGNHAFDSTLLDFLESLKEVEFPPFTHGEKSDIEVTFKTEG